MKETPWLRIRGQNSVDKEFLEIVGNGKPTGSVLKETIAVSVTMSISVQKMTQPNPSPNSFMQQDEKKCVEKPKSQRKKSQWKNVSMAMQGLPIHSVKKWHPPEYWFYKSESGCRFGEKCSYAHRQVDEQPSKRFTKNGDKSAVAMLKITRQLGCVFQDMEPPLLSSILRKSSDIRKPIRCAKFTKAVARHADIIGEPHQRSPNAPKFEDRSQEETEWQDQGAREAAWRLAKSVVKLKEKNKAAFFSPSENSCLPASNLKPEEREFVVDSGASMHMFSKKDLNYAEMDTLTKSCSPTTVTTANGEVKTHEEATVYVNELDFFDYESPREHASSIVVWKALR